MSVSSASRVYFFIFSSFLYSNLAIPCVAASMTGSSGFLRRSTSSDTEPEASSEELGIESRGEDPARIDATSDATRDS
ncbi:unnamed protein product, partial [Amoebophrya sp. A25]|eukprot:GSA25T00006998001.1